MIDTVDPIKCRLTLSDEKDGDSTYSLENSSLEVLDENTEVDIGQQKWAHKWPASKSVLTWKFINHTSDIERAYWQRRAATTAFRTISLLIPRKIRYVRDENVETDISIEFSHDLSIFDNKPNTLAQAYLYHPNNPPGYNGLIQFNDNHFFTPFGDELAAYLVDPVHYDKNNPQLLRTEAFLHILMHEGCHMMGYRHDLNSPESIMYPYAKHGYTREKLNEAAFIWTEDDISRWEAGYGQRSLSSNWLNRLRARRLHGRFKEGIPYRLAV